MRVSDSNRKPRYLLAFVFDDDFIIKKNERIRPWITPKKINTDKASRCVEVFLNQN